MDTELSFINAELDRLRAQVAANIATLHQRGLSPQYRAVLNKENAAANAEIARLKKEQREHAEFAREEAAELKAAAPKPVSYNLIALRWGGAFTLHVTDMDVADLMLAILEKHPDAGPGSTPAVVSCYRCTQEQADEFPEWVHDFPSFK